MLYCLRLTSVWHRTFSFTGFNNVLLVLFDIRVYLPDIKLLGKKIEYNYLCLSVDGFLIFKCSNEIRAFLICKIPYNYKLIIIIIQ